MINKIKNKNSKHTSARNKKQEQTPRRNGEIAVESKRQITEKSSQCQPKNLQRIEHERIEVEDRKFIDTFKEILCVGIDR